MEALKLAEIYVQIIRQIYYLNPIVEMEKQDLKEERKKRRKMKKDPITNSPITNFLIQVTASKV